MRRRIPALVPILLLCVGTGCPYEQPFTRPAQEIGELQPLEWQAGVTLPEAAAAAREAGYPEEEVAELLEETLETGIHPDEMAIVLAKVAESAEQYGPIGDLSGWLSEKMVVWRLRGPPLLRLIEAYHGAWGYYEVNPAERGGPPVFEPSADAGGAS